MVRPPVHSESVTFSARVSHWKVLAPLLAFITVNLIAAPTGKIAWTRPSPVGTYDTYSSMAFGTDNRIYLTGANMPTEGQFDGANVLVTCYSPDGTLQWRKTFDGAAHNYDSGTALAMGSNNTVFVVGDTTGRVGDLLNPASGRDILLQKYASNGQLLWSRMINGELDGTDVSRAILLGQDGRLYFSGDISTSRTGGSPFSALLSCYTAEGNAVWSQYYRAPLGSDAFPLYLKHAANGDLLVLNYINTPGSSGAYASLNRYKSPGTSIWSRVLGSINRYNPPAGLEITSQGDVIAALASYAPEGGMIHALAEDGKTKWSSPFDGVIRMIATDSKNRVIVAGIGTNENGISKTWKVSQYSDQGLPLWTQEMKPEESTFIQELQTDAADNIHVIGSWYSLPGSVPHLHTMVYGSDGSVLWTNRLSQESTAQTLRVDGKGNTYVAAQVKEGNSFKAALIKYSPLLYVEPFSEATAFPVGEKAQLRFSVQGESPIVYQWLFNGLEMSGATNNTLILPNTRIEDEGDYRLVARNKFLTLTSSIVHLRIIKPPRISFDHNNLTFGCGSSTQLLARVESDDLVQFQWRRNGMNIEGATNNPLRVSFATTSLEGNYDVVTRYYGGNRSVTSLVVRVQIDPQFAPTIVQSPGSSVIAAGARILLTASTVSCVPERYQWTMNGLDIPGATNLALLLPPFSPAQVGNYAARVCNDFGCSTTLTARLEINRPPRTENVGMIAAPGTPLLIPKSLLLSKAYDLDGDPIEIESVAKKSFWGASVFYADGQAEYHSLPGFFGVDIFPFTIADGRGGKTTGYVETFVMEGSMPEYNSLGIAIIPAGIRLRYSGPAGGRGMLQHTDHLGSQPWANVIEFVVPSYGVWEYTVPALGKNSFWRTSVE